MENLKSRSIGIEKHMRACYVLAVVVVFVLGVGGSALSQETPSECQAENFIQHIEMGEYWTIANGSVSRKHGSLFKRAEKDQKVRCAYRITLAPCLKNVRQRLRAYSTVVAPKDALEEQAQQSVVDGVDKTIARLEQAVITYEVVDNGSSKSNFESIRGMNFEKYQAFKESMRLLCSIGGASDSQLPSIVGSLVDEAMRDAEEAERAATAKKQEAERQAIERQIKDCKNEMQRRLSLDERPGLGGYPSRRSLDAATRVDPSIDHKCERVGVRLPR